MPQPFNSRDWYWFVGGDTSKVYSSARNIYVDPATDMAYVAWQNLNGTPISLNDESDIWFYVQSFQPWWMWDGTHVSQPALNQYRPGQLNNYNSQVRDAKVNGGMVATGIPIKTDNVSRTYVQGGRAMAIDNKQFQTQWLGSDGNFYPLDANGMIAMAGALGDHTNECYMTFQQVAGGISGGAITTTAQVDSAYSGL